MTDEIPIQLLRGDEPIDYVALADRPKGRALVTLALICCNEEDTIADCIASVKPYIDQWVIAIDIKSQDRTREIILSCLADTPGRLYSHPWFDFSTNRNMLLRAAESHCLAGDALLLMDADDLLVTEDGFALPSELTHDCYNLYFRHDQTRFVRNLIVRAGAKMRYKGRIHEALQIRADTSVAFIEHGSVSHRHMGTRSKTPMRFLQDAFLLEQDLLDDPQDTRSMFYLARSYHGCCFYELAIDRYRRRFEMEGGWQAERLQSLLAIGDCLTALNKPWSEIMDTYLTAWQFDRSYAEPLYAIMRHYADMGGRDAVVVLFGREAIKIPVPKEGLFVNTNVYDYLVKDALAVALYWTRDYQEAAEYSCELYHQGKIPDSELPRIAANWRCCMQGLGFAVADDAVPPEPPPLNQP